MDDERAAGRWHGLAGIGFALTFLVGVILVIDGPDATSPDADFVRFYGGSERNWVLIGMALVAAAAVLFVVFAAGVVARLYERRSAASAGDLTVMLAAAAVPCLALLGAALFAVVPAAMVFNHLPEPAPGILRLSPQMGGPVVTVLLPAVLGLFVVSLALLGRRRRALASWVTVSGIVVGALDMVGGMLFLPTVLAALWIGVVGAVVAIRPERVVTRSGAGTLGAIQGAA